MKRTLLIFVALALLLPPALPAKDKKLGARVHVEFIDGKRIAGELCAIDQRQVSVRLDLSSDVLTQPLAYVANIRMLRMAGKRGNGSGIGALLGAILGGVVIAGMNDSMNSNPNSYNTSFTMGSFDIMGGGFRGLIGLLGGAIVGSVVLPAITRTPGSKVDRMFLFQNQTEEARAAAVKELNEQARDMWDITSPR